MSSGVFLIGFFTGKADCYGCRCGSAVCCSGAGGCYFA